MHICTYAHILKCLLILIVPIIWCQDSISTVQRCVVSTQLRIGYFCLLATCKLSFKLDWPRLDEHFTRPARLSARKLNATPTLPTAIGWGWQGTLVHLPFLNLSFKVNCPSWEETHRTREARGRDPTHPIPWMVPCLVLSCTETHNSECEGGYCGERVINVWSLPHQLPICAHSSSLPLQEGPLHPHHVTAGGRTP